MNPGAGQPLAITITVANPQHCRAVAVETVRTTLSFLPGVARTDKRGTWQKDEREDEKQRSLISHVGHDPRNCKNGDQEQQHTD